MKYEVVEHGSEWIVQHNGIEVARFGEQAEALNEVAARLREASPGAGAASLSMRYQARG
jgi:hypothetical protein